MSGMLNKKELSNVTKLVIRKMAVDAVPSGGGSASAISFLTSGHVGASAKAANEWVVTAINFVRVASGHNPFKDADDETIAGEILRQIEQRKKK